jgi:hypothetical protein
VPTFPDRLLTIRQKTREDLQALNGVVWQDVQGELHSQNLELPTWIVLSQGDDCRTAHQAFLGIIQPLLEEVLPAQFTVTYSILTETTQIIVESLMDHADLTNALSRADFGQRPSEFARRMPDIFGDQVSQPRPTQLAKGAKQKFFRKKHRP